MTDEFKRVDWQPYEYITSAKLNQMTANQVLLSNRKIDACIRNRRADGKRAKGNPEFFIGQVQMWGEYKQFSVDENNTPKDPTIQKTILMPYQMFDMRYLPTYIASPGHLAGPNQIVPLISNPSPGRFHYQLWELESGYFKTGNNFFLSYIGIGKRGNEIPSQGSFSKVDWGSQSRPSQLTKDKFNQMVENQRYLAGRKIDVSVRNYDPQFHLPRPDPINIDTNAALLVDYMEFSPELGDGENAGTVEKQIFFPQAFFDVNYLPSIVISVGPNPQAARQVWKFIINLTEITPSSFTFQMREEGPRAMFQKKDTYWISYMALGVKGG